MGAATACILDANDASTTAGLHAAATSSISNDDDATTNDGSTTAANEPVRPCRSAICRSYGSAAPRVCASHVHAGARHATPLVTFPSTVQLLAPQFHAPPFYAARANWRAPPAVFQQEIC